MVHKRVKIEFIENQKDRVLTFRKRKANLLKKTSELSILCGVDACVIIFGPKQNNEPTRSETWPSNSDEVRRIIERYRISDKPRKQYFASKYFEDKKNKVDEELAKLRKQNWKAKCPSWDDRLNNFDVYQLRTLLGQLDIKLEAANHKHDNFENNQSVMDIGDFSMQSSSQFGQNAYYNMESYLATSSANTYSPNLQNISSLNMFNVQRPIRFQPGQSSHMTPSNGYSNGLQHFADSKPECVQAPFHFQPLQSSFMAPLNPNPMGETANGRCSTELNLFSGLEPLDDRQPIHLRPEQSSYMSSQNPNLMYGNNNNGPLTNLQRFFYPKPLDHQVPIQLQPEQSSHMSLSNPNLVNRQNYDGHSTNLQLFPGSKPLDVQVQLPSQPEQTPSTASLNSNVMEDLIMMKMLNEQNNGNPFGGRPSGNSQFMSGNGLPGVNPTSSMWDNVMSNNIDSSISMNATVPTTQSILPDMPFPRSSFPYQTPSCHVNGLNSNNACESTDQNLEVGVQFEDPVTFQVTKS